MPAFLATVWSSGRQTLAPPRDSKDGILPPLLVAKTAVTGLVDAFSYLVLGHVFVANMTGNVVFLAFSLAGAPGFSAADSLIAIAAFGVGAIAASKLITRYTAPRAGGSAPGSGGSAARAGGSAPWRERLLAATAAAQATLVLIAVILAAVTSTPVGSGYRYVLITLLAIAMGMQNATARKLAVPDLTTTVLTLTITGIAADRDTAKATRRVISVAAMLAGACVGAVLVLHVHIVYPLVVALAILVSVALAAMRSARSARFAPPTRSAG
jgi:uncharacterized membrane protein YoaK (UPF0700 family)